MKCAIIAGGLGTRLRPIIGDLPKPMVPLDGVPLLERLVGLCRRFGIDDIHLVLSYRPEVIREHFGDGSAFGVQLTYWLDVQPLGTAGCLRQMLPMIVEDLLVLYGDVFVEMDLTRLLVFHQQHQGAATLVVHPNDHPYDSDLIEVHESHVTAFHKTPHPEGVYYANCVNAGVYMLGPALLRHIPEGRPCDFARDVFPAALAAGERLAAYNTPEYIKDIGTPDRCREVDRDIRAGKPLQHNLAHARKAVFLDRDGTINTWVPLLDRLEQFELNSGAGTAIRAINEAGYLAIVVTNQPQLARGLLTERQLQCVHNKMETLLGYERAKLDAIYYCPHHPDRGYAGEVAELKISCRCRKPDTLLYELAAEQFHIDLPGSAVVGDSLRDIEAARRLDCRSVLVQTGLAGSDVPPGITPDFVASDLIHAVRWITERQS